MLTSTILISNSQCEDNAAPFFISFAEKKGQKKIVRLESLFVVSETFDDFFPKIGDAVEFDVPVFPAIYLFYEVETHQ